MKHSLLILLLFATGRQLKAQDTTQSQRDIQVQQVLGMDREEYKSYKDSLKQYDTQLTGLLADSSLEKNAKASKITNVLDARRAYVQRHLTPEQRQKLHELNRQHAMSSPREKNLKALEARLKARGIKVYPDSTGKTTSYNNN